MKPISSRHQIVLSCASIVLIILGLLVIGYRLATYPPADSDFIQDYQAAQALLEQKSIYSFWNPHPPLNAILCLPFAALALPQALLLFGLLSLILFLLCLRLLLGEYAIPFYQRIFILAASVIWPEHQTAIILGTTSSLVTCLLIVGWVALRRKQGYFAGVCFGIASLMKLYPGFLLLFILASRKWTTLISFIATLLAGGILGLLVVGWSDHQLFLKFALQTNLEKFLDFKENLSLPGTIERLFGQVDGWTVPLVELPRPVVGIISFGCVALLCLWLLRVVRQNSGTRSGDDLCFAATCAAMLLVSPISWGHYLVTLILPIVIVFFYSLQVVRTNIFVILAITVLLVSGMPGVINDLLVTDPDLAPFPWYRTVGFIGATLGIVSCLMLSVRLLAIMPTERESGQK